MKNKKYRKIKLVFENCESVWFPAKAIEHFCISGITKTISQINWGAKEKFFDEQLHCDGISIVLNNTANDKNYCSSRFFSENTIFDRIRRFNDITSVNLFYKDGSFDTFFVPWKGSDENNELQKTQYNEDSKELTIKIGKQ